MSPATAKTAAVRLCREAVTIRQWARRYGVRVLGKPGREVVYDFAALATIEGCIWREGAAAAAGRQPEAGGCGLADQVYEHTNRDGQ